MIKIYIIWQYNPILEKEEVKGYNRNKEQAELQKPSWPDKGTVREFVIDLDLLESIRNTKLEAIDTLISDFTWTGDTSIEKESLMMVRCDLSNNKREIKARLDESHHWIFDDEIRIIMQGIEEGII